MKKNVKSMFAAAVAMFGIVATAVAIESDGVWGEGEEDGMILDNCGAVVNFTCTTHCTKNIHYECEEASHVESKCDPGWFGMGDEKDVNSAPIACQYQPDPHHPECYCPSGL